MNNQDITKALADLTETARALEDAYIDGGGEVTEETERLEAEKSALAKLLTTEGVDSLGRWLRSKEDEVAMWKAEKAAADKRMKSAEKTIDYIRGRVGEVLRATGQEKVKGSFYAFAQAVSTKNSIDGAALDEAYLHIAQDAARKAGLPECIDVALKTNVTRVIDGGLAQYVNTEETPTSKFTKPRKADES